MGVYGPLIYVCYGGVERRDDPQRSISYLSRKRRELGERTIPLPLDLILLSSHPRAESPDIMVHTWVEQYIYKLSLPFLILVRPPSPSFSSSSSFTIPHLVPRHRHSYNSARCKLHNLVTVSPGIVPSRTIPLS